MLIVAIVLTIGVTLVGFVVFRHVVERRQLEHLFSAKYWWGTLALLVLGLTVVGLNTLIVWSQI